MKKFLANLFAFVMMFSILSMNLSTAEAGAHIDWQTDDVKLQKGKCIITGKFKNTGNVGTSITKFTLAINISDMDGRYIWHGSGTWTADSNLTVGYVPAGGYRDWSFSITDSSIPAYTGNFKCHWDSCVWWIKKEDPR